MAAHERLDGPKLPPIAPHQAEGAESPHQPSGELPQVTQKEGGVALARAAQTRGEMFALIGMLTR